MFKMFASELIGAWHIEREIKTFGKATGEAIFSKDANNLIFYREDIILFNGTKSFREYYYAFDPLLKQTLQLFNDKRIFCILEFDEEQKTAKGKHLCGKDYYYVKYFFNNQNSFTTEYKIMGPHKCETIVTEYTR